MGDDVSCVTGNQLDACLGNKKIKKADEEWKYILERMETDGEI